MTHDGNWQAVTAYLADVAARIDQGLDAYLPHPGPFAAVLGDAMRYSVYGAGKRLRAALVLESAYLCGGAREQAVPLAVAIEMIHAYSLVHDDLPCMDDDDMRRGKPANHKVFGEGIAVLAGDGLLTEAFGLLARLPELTGVDPAAAVRIIGEVARAAGACGMVGGQAADLLAERQEPHPDMLEYIHTHKTGALFGACVRGGALLAGAGEDALAALTRFAHHFGVAYQIVDDLLDVQGDPSLLGKAVGSDQKQQKLTFPRVYGIERSERMAADHITAAHACLEPFGARAEMLHRLTDFALTRRH